MYFFIKLQIVCFLTLLLLIAELVVDHFTHSLTLLVVAWQTLYNFLSLFISGVSLALSHNNSRELLKKVIQVNFNYRCYRIRCMHKRTTKLLFSFAEFHYRVHSDGEEQVLLVLWSAQYSCVLFYLEPQWNHCRQYDIVIILM